MERFSFFFLFFFFNRQHREKVQGFIKRAVEEGGKLIYGGETEGIVGEVNKKNKNKNSLFFSFFKNLFFFFLLGIQRWRFYFSCYFLELH